MATEQKLPGLLPDTKLWQIMVPKYMENWEQAGTPWEVPIEHHNVWDSYVENIAGGSTIFRSAQGNWVDPTDWARFSERMIPVQIACSDEQMLDIAQFTKGHYDQRKVFFYEISQRVFIL